jgi:hypothetical protein
VKRRALGVFDMVALLQCFQWSREGCLAPPARLLQALLDGQLDAREAP